MRAETAHSRADGGASPEGHPPMPAEQPGHVFVDERGRRTRLIRWLGRGMTALAGLYIVMLVGGALFGVSIVPRLSLPRVILPFAAPRAADPEPAPVPVAQATADAQPEAGPRATSASATAATAQAATARPAALRLSSAPGGSQELPAAPAPSPSAPVDAPATPATAPSPPPTPGQQGQEVAGAHGGGKDKAKDKAKEEAGGPPADPTTDGTTDGATDGTGRGSPKGRTAA